MSDSLFPLTIKEILASNGPVDSICVRGWVRTRRDSKGFSFMEINDGSGFRNLQVILDATIEGAEHLHALTTGASVAVTGALVPSKGAGQAWELQARHFSVLGTADATYPLQKKGHSPEFLREIAHLRPRTNLTGSLLRVRSKLAFAVHQFFQDHGFHYAHTPIITASDCEGAGEMFQVTTLEVANPPRSKEGTVDYGQDFFKKAAYLTVSGQLEAEALACAMGRVYTFGPTFRAENSHTSRHASEFWMIEPEMAFADLEMDMALAEAFIKHLIRETLQHCADEVAFFNKFVDTSLAERLKFVLDRPFQRVSYTEAVKILQQSGESFAYPVAFGTNLQSEHERWLTEKHFQYPVTVYNYPRTLKPFYMRQNDDDLTVAAMDVLVPGIGEIIGGSQREERHERLQAAMQAQHLPVEEYQWYLQLRQYGTVPHAGFGLGFERMLMFVTGIPNIRDVIPFPRTPGVCSF